MLPSRFERNGHGLFHVLINEINKSKLILFSNESIDLFNNEF